MTPPPTKQPALPVTLGQHSCGFAPWRPQQGQVFDRFAFDCETTRIDKDHPYLTPAYVLGAACDGRHGVFVPRDQVAAFFQAHASVPFVCHHAAFDLRVVDVLLRPTLDIYQAVEEGRVRDTLLLHRLLMLGTEGHTARGCSGLADALRQHLGLTLPKEVKDDSGQTVRTSFGAYLNRPPSEIPALYLGYLGRDALGTWMLVNELECRITKLLATAPGIWGCVDAAWLQEVGRRFGPLTHDIQLRASIVLDAISGNGIDLDVAAGRQKADHLAQQMVACKKRMRLRGYLAGEPGCAKALQSLIREINHKHHGLDLRRTEKTAKWATDSEQLEVLARIDDFFQDLHTYRTCEKLLSTYLHKMQRQRVYAQFSGLMETGRTSCGGGLNLQNLPRPQTDQGGPGSIRGVFVPDKECVFVDADYAQIELVVLAYALQHQFRLGNSMARLINSGQDLHRRIAAVVLGKPADQVTKAERNSVKAISFGRPGGMGAKLLRQVAAASYGITLDLNEVQRRIDAYHGLCPELDRFLADEVPLGRVLAEKLQLTPAAYGAATGRWISAEQFSRQRPAAWLGGMLLKVLAQEQPTTSGATPRLYSDRERDWFWQRAQPLADVLPDRLVTDLKQRRPSPQLAAFVRNWVGRRPVFTLTGRLRANATFSSARNTIFQGPAADGAILGLWLIWRAGYRIANFVHDQVVVNVAADDKVTHHAGRIEELMRHGMAMVLPQMRIGIETVITRSLDKRDVDPRYPPSAAVPNRTALASA